MGNENGNYGWLKKVVLIFVPVIILLSGVLLYASRGSLDNEFDKGTNIAIENLDDNKMESLNKLCRVWGFTKYYHPEVISGSLNWDYELFRVMPSIIESKNQDETNKILYEWINGIGEFKQGTYEGGKEVKLEANTSWIEDEKYLGSNLSNILIKLSKTYVLDRDKAYVSYKNNSIFSNFDNEKAYPSINYSDDGYKLLSLFRYWNIIEHYYPYRGIMEEDWNGVLNEFIPKVINSDEDLDYKLVMSELTTKIHDSHASIYDLAKTLYNYFGNNVAPINFLVVEDKIVITNIDDKYKEESNLKVGDVVLEVNDKNIFDVIKEKSKYISFSHDDAIVNGLSYYLFRTNDERLRMKIERDGKEAIKEVKCYPINDVNISRVSPESHKTLEGNIGYIDAGAVGKGEIDKIMKNLNETKGIVVDLRNYPGDTSLVYTMPNYLLPEKVVFSRVTIANKQIPGEFVFDEDIEVGGENKDYYKGKVVVIVNECTQSNGEFTAMALRKSPNAVVIGENTIGADGDVAMINLPGGLTTSITGIGIYTPEGEETQRVGIKPDIYVEPTIKGIRDGKDELFDKAIEIIKS